MMVNNGTKVYASVRSSIVIFIHRLIQFVMTVGKLDMLMVGMDGWIIQSQMEGQSDQCIQTTVSGISKYTEDFLVFSYSSFRLFWQLPMIFRCS